MPKEFTEDCRATDFRDGIRKGQGVSVRWNKKDLKVPNSSPIVHPLTLTFDTDDPNLSGIKVIVGLDREGCNNLIKSLRQARNDVYGRDS